MGTYLSPGVFVEEKSSGLAPIAGAGTSTAGFIGVYKKEVKIKNLINLGEKKERIHIGKGNGEKKVFSFQAPNTQLLKNTNKISLTKLAVTVDGVTKSEDAKILLKKGQFVLRLKEPPGRDKEIKVTLTKAKIKPGSRTLHLFEVDQVNPVTDHTINVTNDHQTEFVIKGGGFTEEGVAIINFDSYQEWQIKVEPPPQLPLAEADAGAGTPGQTGKGTNNQPNIERVEEDDGWISIHLTNAPVKGGIIEVSYQELEIETFPAPENKKVMLCTNFGEFKRNFGGDFLNPEELDTKGQNTLAHAVYGFFKNGGTRCYVAWTTESEGVEGVLEKFEAIDDISIVAAPGCSDDDKGKIKDHCEKMGDRFAILDCKKVEENDRQNEEKVDKLKNFNSDYAALYYPWIKVKDPASNKEILVPPSGHIAGVYARVDNQRGVHKAPANETIKGALELPFNISKAKQDGLNPQGINCIRKLNGNILIWGARTLGGNANREFKYVNVRRYFNYLKQSIDEGTQWTVFEPNTPELWARIRRNITAFLTNEWRQGALFGTSPDNAFFVKCDEELNPPDVREMGQVYTEIGVSVIKPAEFVIFQLSQWTGGN